MLRTTLLAGLLLAAPGARGRGPVALRAHAGVPVPITLYGYDAQSGGVSTRAPVYGGVGMTYLIAEPWSAGARLSGATLIGEHGDNEARAWFVSGGLEAELRCWAPGTDDALGGLSVALGPSLLRNAVVVDENIRIDTWALGARGAVLAGWPLAEAWSIEGAVAFEIYGPPLDKETYFNEPLGRTALLTLALGVSFAP